MSRGGRQNGDQAGRGRGGSRGNAARGRGRGRGGGGGGWSPFGIEGGAMASTMKLDDMFIPTGPRPQGAPRGRGRGAGGGLRYNLAANSGQQRGSGYRGGRGQSSRGRGRGGGSLAVQGQNAVGFDYSSINPRVRIETDETTTITDEQDGVDGDDIVIEPRRGYKHVVRPHLEVDTPETLSSRQSSLPNSSRASPSIDEYSRAERIRSGQVAAIIPTTTQAARLYGMYKQDLPVFKKVSERKKKDPFFVRPPQDDPFDDACMGGIPRHMRKRPQRFNREALPPRFENEQRHPPTFVKARGQWSDGKWIREDGVEGDIEVLGKKDSAQAPHFESNVGLGGIGFAGAKEAPEEEMMDFDISKELAEYGDGLEGEENAVQSLLQQFPGSLEIAEGDTIDSTLDWYKAPKDFGLLQAQSTMEAAPSPDSTPKEVTGVDQGPGPEDMVEDDADDVILIPQSGSKDDEASKGGIEGTIESEEAFFVDTEGGMQTAVETVRYETTTDGVLGEQPVESVAESEEEDWSSSDAGKGKKPRALGGKKARNAVKKARRRARRSSTNKGPLVPREGDSDIEWGSDGPPPVLFRKSDDQTGFLAQQDEELTDIVGLRTIIEANHAPSTAEEEERHLSIALENSLVDARSSSKKGRKRQSHKDAILSDYMENALAQNSKGSIGEDVEAEERDDDLIDKQSELDAMLRFMQGMDGQRQGRETTMDDIEMNQQLQEEEEWMTDSEDSDVDSEAEDILDRQEKSFADSVSSSDESDDESDGEDDDSSGDDEEDRHGGGDEGSGSTDEEDEDSAFDRSFTWAEEDEEFIARIEKFATANDGILKGRNRAARNKLFKAIETGDFTMMDGGANGGIDDLDNLDLAGLQPAKKGGKRWHDNDPMAQQLQAQWERDRAKKADNKRKRAELRALEAQNPFPNTNGKGKGAMKKTLKKAARAARRAERLSAIQENVKDDGVDMVDALFAGGGLLSDPLMRRQATSLLEVNRQIELFLEDRTKTTLSLPPMDKRLRAQVHQLSMCYSIVSKSQGSGNNRFPTLIKNSRSAIPAKRGRINAILRSCGSLGSGMGGGNKYGGGDRTAAGRKGKERVPLPRNQEGAEVGFGAERIGQENIGHKLLSAMGWIEGSGVGATQGMSEPVGATIKISKGGLGF